MGIHDRDYYREELKKREVESTTRSGPFDQFITRKTSPRKLRDIDVGHVLVGVVVCLLGALLVIAWRAFVR